MKGYVTKMADKLAVENEGIRNKDENLSLQRRIKE
jgi:hypothetical protein